MDNGPSVPGACGPSADVNGPQRVTLASGEEVTVVFVTRPLSDPVRPVSEYCAALEAWWDAIGQSEDERLKEMHDDKAFSLVLAIRKSNLLHRLIYRGERLRTERCPEHKGRWSGYGWGRQCACQDYEHGGYGPDITGWLPRRDEPKAAGDQTEAEPESITQTDSASTESAA